MNNTASFEARTLLYLLHGEEYPVLLPPVPDIINPLLMQGVAVNFKNNNSYPTEKADLVSKPYPNPANGTINLASQLNQGDIAIFRLYDLTEQEIVEFEALAVNDNTAAATYIQSLLATPRLQTYERIPQPITQSGKRPNQIKPFKNVSWFQPNPATNNISINGIEPWQTLTLYNLYGQVEESYTYSSETLQFPLSLANGMYILSIQLRDGNVKTGKLFITK